MKLTINDKSALRAYLEEVAKSAVGGAIETVNSIQGEKNRQAQFTQDIASAVGKKQKNPKATDEDDDEDVEEDLFADEDEDDEEDLFADEDEDEKKPEKKKAQPEDDGTHDNHGDDEKNDDHFTPEAEDVTPDMIIQQINTIRSGRSMKDEEVHVEMTHYVENLSPPEKLALYTFTKGIGAIVAGGEEGESAPDPADRKVKITGGEQGKTDDKNDRAIASTKKPSEKTPSKSEDTTPPIKIGEVSKTESIRRAIRLL